MNPKETLKRVAGDVLWQASKAVRHEVIDPNGNLEKARNQLRTGSLIIIVNHPHRLDTTAIGHFVENHLSPLEHVAAMTALKHSDPNRHEFDPSVKRSEFAIINLGQKSRNFKLLRVVQGSEDERIYYTNHPEPLGGKSIPQFNSDAFGQAVELLRTAGNIVMVAPEGTRSINGQLGEAQPGVELLLHRAKDTALILPVGIIIPDSGKVTIGKTRFKMVIGDLISNQDVQAEHEQNPEIKRKNIIFGHVARLLPPENRGVYANLVS